MAREKKKSGMEDSKSLALNSLTLVPTVINGIMEYLVQPVQADHNLLKIVGELVLFGGCLEGKLKLYLGLANWACVDPSAGLTMKSPTREGLICWKNQLSTVRDVILDLRHTESQPRRKLLALGLRRKASQNFEAPIHCSQTGAVIKKRWRQNVKIRHRYLDKSAR